jgi:hypothetical protein
MERPAGRCLRSTSLGPCRVVGLLRGYPATERATSRGRLPFHLSLPGRVPGCVSEKPGYMQIRTPSSRIPVLSFRAMPSSFLSTFVRLVALEDPRNGAPRYVPRRGEGDFLLLPALVHVAYTRSVVVTLRLSSRANQYHARSATSALKPLSALLSLSRHRVTKADNDEREDSDLLLYTNICLP